MNCLHPDAAIVDDAVNTLSLHVEDHDEQQLDFPRVLAWMDAVWAANNDSAVLVHCAMGISRSASLYVSLSVKVF